MRGDHANAESSWLKAIHTLESEGAADRRYAASLDGLGKAYAGQKRYPQAELAFARSIKLKETIFGNVSIEVAKTCNLLAAVFYEQGKFLQTESLGHRAYTIYEKVLGIEHPAVTTMSNNLARVQKKLAKIQAQAQAQQPSTPTPLFKTESGQSAGEPSNSQGASQTPQAAQPESQTTAQSERKKTGLVCDVCGRIYSGPSCLQCTQSLSPIEFGLDALGPQP